MKFDKAFDKTTEPVFHAESHHEESPLDDVFDYKLYNNIVVYIMKFGIKGNFKMFAPLVNNGKIAPSWAIRIYYLNNQWTIHIAPHPNLELSTSLVDEVDSIIDNKSIQIVGHNHVAMTRCQHKITVENIVNKLIDFYKDKQIDGIENQAIDSRFITESSTTKYRIPSSFKIVEEFDEETYKKYLLIIKQLIDNKNLNEEERNEVMRIAKRFFKAKTLNKHELDQINLYVENHIDQHSKIKIALQYILSSKN